MQLKSIASHLRPYRMLARRRTTINHMFAAAIAPHDLFDEERVREAVALLGNDPDSDLACAYCGELAETWDHVFAISGLDGAVATGCFNCDWDWR